MLALRNLTNMRLCDIIHHRYVLDKVVLPRPVPHLPCLGAFGMCCPPSSPHTPHQHSAMTCDADSLNAALPECLPCVGDPCVHERPRVLCVVVYGSLLQPFMKLADVD